LLRSGHAADCPLQLSNQFHDVPFPLVVAHRWVVYPFNIGPMQTARLLHTIKQNKNAVGA